MQKPLKIYIFYFFWNIYGTTISSTFSEEMKKLGALGVILFGCAILPYIYLIPVDLLSRSMPYGGGSLALYFLALPMFIFIFLEAAVFGIGTVCIVQQSKPRALGFFAVLLSSAYLVGIISIAFVYLR